MQPSPDLGIVLTGRLRRLLCLLAVVALLVLPLLRQGCGLAFVPSLQWRMYSGSNDTVCAVQAKRSHSSPTTRIALPRAPVPKRLFPHTAVFTSPRSALQKLIDQTCADLDGDVAFDVRCAVPQGGFASVIRWTDPVCDGARFFPLASPQPPIAKAAP